MQSGDTMKNLNDADWQRRKALEDAQAHPHANVLVDGVRIASRINYTAIFMLIMAVVFVIGFLLEMR